MVTMAHPWVLPIFLSIYTFVLYMFINVNPIECHFQGITMVQYYYKARKLKLEQEIMDKKIDLYKRAMRIKNATKERRTIKKVVGVKIIRSPSKMHNNLISTIWLGGVPFQDPLMNNKNKSRKEGINKRRHFVLQFKNNKGEWIILLNFVMVDFYIYTRSTFNQIDEQRTKLKNLALENEFVVIRACKRGSTTLCAENTFSAHVLIEISERKASFLVNVGSVSCPYALSHIINDVNDFDPMDEPPDKSVVDDIVKIYVPLANRGILTPKCKNRSYLPLENLTADFQYPPMILFSATIVILGNIIFRKVGLVSRV